MSRSWKKVPISGNLSASDKADKALANRHERRAVSRGISQSPDCAILPLKREVTDVWNFAKDGKGYRGVDPEGKNLRK